MIALGLSPAIASALAALVSQTAPPAAWPSPAAWAPPAAMQTAPAAMQTAPAAPAPLPKAGFFELGINLDLIEIGALQAFGSGGSSSGVVLALGPEIDLGPHAALRIPLRLGFAGDVESPTSFAELVLAPGYIYRFRHDRYQHWVPFAGGGLALGAFQFGRQLLGLAPSPAGVSQSFVKLGVAPEAIGGILYSPVRFFALRFAGSYTYMLVARSSAHVLTETFDVRLMF